MSRWGNIRSPRNSVIHIKMCSLLLSFGSWAGGSGILERVKYVNKRFFLLGKDTALRCPMAFPKTEDNHSYGKDVQKLDFLVYSKEIYVVTRRYFIDRVFQKSLHPTLKFSYI